MTIRSQALKWLVAREVLDGHVVTSKRYRPDESWTREKAWWIQIPLSAVRDCRLVHIVCEADAPEQGFHHLQVPTEFLESHLNDFALIGGNKINLFLAIDSGKIFQDQRGPGKVSFARFEQ